MLLKSKTGVDNFDVDDGYLMIIGIYLGRSSIFLFLKSVQINLVLLSQVLI